MESSGAGVGKTARKPDEEGKHFESEMLSQKRVPNSGNWDEWNTVLRKISH